MSSYEKSDVLSDCQREVPRKWRAFNGYWRAELAPPAMKEMPLIESKYRDLIKAYGEQRWKNLTTRVSTLFPFLHLL